jgi:two-component system, NtrC family, nitrogen regulation sensor histidine kinase NtrY
MIGKNFRINIILRVALLACVSLVLAYVLLRNTLLFVPIALGVALIGVLVNLIWYIEKSSRDLTHFLLSIRQGAFTESYPSPNRGKDFEALSEALNEVINEFAKLNLEKELHFQYLQALNENINVAIMSFDQEGKLLMMNPSAKRLLNLPSFSRLEHFKRVDSALYNTIQKIQPEERVTTRVVIGEEQYQLGIQMKEILLRGEKVSILLLQNLSSELEAKEIEAWYQLIRVLTHEIMNSVTPIVSLTGAIQGILKNGDGSFKNLGALSPDNREDLFHSLSTIESRSKGLLKFVNAYKEYAKPLDLHLEQADAVKMVHQVIDLLKTDLDNHQIQWKIVSPDTAIQVKADLALMDQVLINLVKNAMEAVRDDGTGEVILSVKSNPGKNAAIFIHDNGKGIEAEVLPKIFIPFFTTKPKGSGIGLSLSRQIVKLHGGTIKVSSGLGKGSVFTVEW